VGENLQALVDQEHLAALGVKFPDDAFEEIHGQVDGHCSQKAVLVVNRSCARGHQAFAVLINVDLRPKDVSFRILVRSTQSEEFMGMEFFRELGLGGGYPWIDVDEVGSGCVVDPCRIFDG